MDGADAAFGEPSGSGQAITSGPTVGRQVRIFPEARFPSLLPGCQGPSGGICCPHSLGSEACLVQALHAEVPHCLGLQRGGLAWAMDTLSCGGQTSCLHISLTSHSMALLVASAVGKRPGGGLWLLSGPRGSLAPGGTAGEARHPP